MTEGDADATDTKRKENQEEEVMIHFSCFNKMPLENLSITKTWN